MKRILIAAAIVVVVVASFYIYWRAEIHPQPSAPNTDALATPGAVVASSTLQTRTAPAGYQEYANAAYGISLFYPHELAVTEYSEAAGGHTISFDSADGTEGFQIYIIPYGQPQITDTQMRSDTHGTAVLPPQEVVLGSGQHALFFASSDPVRGDLREVWSIRSGNLFEVTTYAGNDSWLASILNTLTFI